MVGEVMREEGNGCGGELGMEGLLFVVGELQKVMVVGRFGFEGFKVGELSG